MTSLVMLPPRPILILVDEVGNDADGVQPSRDEDEGCGGIGKICLDFVLIGVVGGTIVATFSKENGRLMKIYDVTPISGGALRSSATCREW